MSGKVVFTSGCFDLFHGGHLHLLREARKLGDKLVVCVNDDAYCRSKGKGRPIWGVSDRLAAVLDTGLVSEAYVIQESPLERILAICPDFIVVGDDYTPERVVGGEEGKAWGCKVVIVKRLTNLSTTELMRK